MPCLVLDTALFVLTLYRTLSHGRKTGSSLLLGLILRDGAWAYLLSSGKRCAGAHGYFLDTAHVAILLVNLALMITQKGPLAWFTAKSVYAVSACISLLTYVQLDDNRGLRRGTSYRPRTRLALTVHIVNAPHSEHANTAPRPCRFTASCAKLGRRAVAPANEGIGGRRLG
jgi:hypothetical protein